MEKLAKRLADAIGEMLSFDNEKIAVLAYGFTALFQMGIIFAIASIVGILGRFWYECMILFLGVGLLRKSVGGAHSETYTGCLFISIFTISFLAFLSRFLSKYLFLNNGNAPAVWIFTFIVFAVAFIVTYIKAPVDSKHKPIVKPEKIKRLRHSAFITIFLYFAAAVIFIYFSDNNPRLLSVSFSFAFATLWQTFVLTGAGHKFIKIIDRKFTVNE